MTTQAIIKASAFDKLEKKHSATISALKAEQEVSKKEVSDLLDGVSLVLEKVRKQMFASDAERAEVLAVQNKMGELINLIEDRHFKATAKA